MAGRARNKTKIRTHKIDDYINTNNVSKEIVEELRNSLNGDSSDLKRIAKDVIKNLPRLKCKNAKQKEFYRLLEEKDVVACQGVAGTGKTHLSVYCALKTLLNPDNKIERIILTKPAQQLATENLGFIKGSIEEKVLPIMESYQGIFEDIIGIAAHNTLVEKGIIVYKPMAFLRGTTMKNSYIIFDEVQMASLHATRTLMQRMGEDSKLNLLGDRKQTEIKNRKNNPLSLLINKFELIDEFGTFEFTIDDIIRNKLIIIFEKIFEEIENDLSNK